MRPALFTPQELEELRRFDAQIDAEKLSVEDYREARQRDKELKYALRPDLKKRAAAQRAYYEANREKLFAVGREIKTARKNRGYTQKALAKLIGVSQTALYFWESGSVTPDIEKLLPILPELRCVDQNKTVDTNDR